MGASFTSANLSANLFHTFSFVRQLEAGTYTIRLLVRGPGNSLGDDFVNITVLPSKSKLSLDNARSLKVQSFFELCCMLVS